MMSKKERFTPGHRMCAGCGAPIAVRNVLRALKDEDKAVVTCATSCLEVSTFMYPYTSWEDSFIHNAFENAGATCSGVESAYRALKKKGKIDDTYKFIAFGGTQAMIIFIATCASIAMLFPISTPPNAIASSTGLVETKDMAKVGIIVGVVGFVLGFFWLTKLFPFA